MSETVYIETSILGYLTARPSRDLVVAANIEITREWWDTRRSGHWFRWIGALKALTSNSYKA
ncbi:MAG: hypothetical protein NW224_21905 [Leptolyngbyaceae cyanobacterium bins.302]|nr:hypothetical protein [Leptolyngbyaceae cyanobacterium bins.302]